MSLKDILAARKAKEAATEVVIEKEEVAAKPSADILDAIIGTVSETVKEEPPAPAKPMSFAEKMAGKKRLAEAKANPVAEQPVGKEPELPPELSNISERLIAAVKSTEPVTLTPDQEAIVEEQDDSDLAQAYTDIALKLNSLTQTEDGEDLRKAMAELKKALRDNPSASMLILDSDIGQMVIALRRMTQTELVVASEPKKRGPAKAKNVTLTQEQIAAAWDEL